MSANIHDIDREVRELLLQPIDEQVRDAAIDRVRLRLVEEMAADAPRRGAPRLRRPRAASIAIACLVIALAGFVAVLVDPLGDSGPGTPAIPLLAKDANAAEALSWAGQVLEEEGTPIGGTGPVLHSVQVTRHDGEVVRVSERWVNTVGPEFRTVDTEDHRSDGRVMSLQTADFDGKVERARSFLATSRDDWHPQTLSNNLDYVGGREPAAPLDGPNLPWTPNLKQPPENPGRYEGVPYRITATVTVDVGLRRWASAIEETTDAEVVTAATRTFMSTTEGLFRSPEQGGGSTATEVRQLVFLLGAAPVTPAAGAALYAMLGDANGLERLSDVKVEGREAIRIRFASPPSALGDLDTDAARLARTRAAQAQVVLVIDAKSGSPVQVESIDRQSRKVLERGTRVAHVGDDFAICDTVATFVPCSLLDGTHPAAKRATAMAASAEAREMLIGANTPIVPYTIDAQGRPVDKDGNVVEHPMRDGLGRPIPILPLGASSS